MSTIPQPEVGHDSTVLTLYRQSVDGLGVLGNTGTIADLLLHGGVDSVRISDAFRTVNLSPMNLMSENNVIVEFGSTWTISGLQSKLKGINDARNAFIANGLGVNTTNQYVVGHWVHGATDEVFTGLMTNLERDMNKDKGSYVLTIKQVALVGAPNPVVTEP